MTKKSGPRRSVNIMIGADLNRLYGTLDEAIAYLEEVRDAYPGTNISLHENWTGYEDMDMAFSYDREENDEEYISRLAAEKAEQERHARNARAEAEKAERRKAYLKLKREFG